MCTLCAVHTYASEVGAGVCSPCPDAMRSAVGSVSEAACACVVGFLNVSGVCTQLLDVSVVLKLDLVLEQPSDLTMEQVRQRILSVVSVQYNISAEFLVVDIALLPVVSTRRLMQAVLNVTSIVMQYTKYSITVRVLFVAGASQADVSQIQSLMATIDSEKLNAGLHDGSSGVQFNVVNSTVREIRDVQGVFNVNSREVVTCTLMPWYDERGAALACVRTCRVDEDVFAVAYVQGLYVLDCKSKTGTPVEPPIVVPPIDGANQALSVVAIDVGVGLGLLALGVVACIVLSRKPANK